MSIYYSKVIEAPDSEPVTLAEAKVQLKLEDDFVADDALITSLIKTARRLCESYSSLSFVTQGRRMKLDHFPCWRKTTTGIFARWRRHDGIIIPYGPVQTIDSIKYFDSNDEEQTLDPSAYTADTHSELARVFPVDNWPSTNNGPNAVTIDYTAGYDPVSGGTEEFPEQAKQAILMQVTSFYENRQDEGPEKMSMVCWNSQKFLDTIKVYWNANED